MARSMWRGAIQFGLVTIPVRLYLATDSKGIAFGLRNAQKVADGEPLGGGGDPAADFQKVPNYVAPTWPDGPVPQQLHLDFLVPDLDEGEAHALAVGATKHDYQPGTTFRVFLDPVGHPFCLVFGQGMKSA